MNRYVISPHTVFIGPRSQGSPSKTNWRIFDMAAPPVHVGRFWRNRAVAWAEDEAIARRIADMLNGVQPHTTYWKDKAEAAIAGVESARKELRQVSARAMNYAETIDRLRKENDELTRTVGIRDADQADLLAGQKRDRAQIETLRDELRRTQAKVDEHLKAVADIFKRLQRAEAGERANGAEAERARTELAELREKLIGPAYGDDSAVLLALARHINRVCFKS